MSTEQIRNERNRRNGAVRAANRWRKKGWIVKERCKNCNDPFTEMHHPDYSKPLEVIWLCKKCHGREQRRLRDIGEILTPTAKHTPILFTLADLMAGKHISLAMFHTASQKTPPGTS